MKLRDYTNPHPITKDDAARFQARCTIEAAGCDVTSYTPYGFIVAIQVGARDAIAAACATVNARLEFLHFFPLCSDNAPAEFRHHCPPYTAERGHTPGFWRYERVIFN